MQIQGRILAESIKILKNVFYMKTGEVNEQSIQIAANVKCAACILSATNEELEVRLGIFGTEKVQVSKNISVTVDAENIDKAIAAINKKDIFISLEEVGDNEVNLSGDGLISIHKKQNKAELLKVPKKGAISVFASSIADAFAANAVASNAKALYGMGLDSMVQVQFDAKSSTFTTKSSDSKVLCRAEVEIDDITEEKDFSFVISAAAADAICKIFAIENGSVEVSVLEKGNEKWIGFRGNKIILSVKTVKEEDAEKYPSFSSLLNMNYPQRMVIEKKDFVRLLQNASRVLKKEERYKVNLTVEDGVLTLTTQSFSKSVKVEANCILAVDLNISLLLRMANVIQYPKIAVEITENKRLFRVSPEISTEVVMIAGTLNQPE